MISHEDGGYAIPTPGLIEWYEPRELEKLRALERSSKLKFIVPERFKTKKEVTIYKVGFLRNFLKLLYPEEKYRDLVDIMNQRYQLFLGKRQIERYVKEYEKDVKYH